MGITTLIGMIVCLAAIVYGIISVDGKMENYVNLPSVLTTVIPTIGAIISTYPIEVIAKIPSHFKILLGKGYRLEDHIEKIMGLARKARSDGLLALEDEKTDMPFMNYAMSMVVDGLDEETIRNSLERNLAAVRTRHEEVLSLYEKAAAYAPAFGMCATVIGLINMLMGLDFNDPTAVNSLGSNMSMALITTLYGSMMANIFFLPIAGRLRLLHKREIFCKTMIGNGFLAIHRGENPNIIHDALVEQLSEKSKKLFAGANAGGAAREG